jgi:hypothetical protein
MAKNDDTDNADDVTQFVHWHRQASEVTLIVFYWVIDEI